MYQGPQLSDFPNVARAREPTRPTTFTPGGGGDPGVYGLGGFVWGGRGAFRGGLGGLGFVIFDRCKPGRVSRRCQGLHPNLQTSDLAGEQIQFCWQGFGVQPGLRSGLGLGIRVRGLQGSGFRVAGHSF